MELELVKGSIDFKTGGALESRSLDLDVNTMSIYLSQQTDGKAFLKTKIGLLQESISGPVGTEMSEVGLSWGIGGGYTFTENLSVEAEYVKVEQDVAWLLISGRYSLGW